jgi:hypothetical protein
MEALGIGPGPGVGRILAAVEEAQGAGEIGSREEALALARRLLPQERVGAVASTAARSGGGP